MEINDTSLLRPKTTSPKWHEEARQLRKEGWSYGRIARKFDLSATAVYFLFFPEKRHLKKAKKNEKAINSIPSPIGSGHQND